MLLFESVDCIFNYVDVGARGNLSAPWSTYLSSKTKLIGFEPDQKEYNDLVKLNPQNEYFPLGLWDKNESINFYLNQDEYTSSMFLPNTEYIKSFEEKHWKNRIPKETFSIQCDLLDNLLSSKSIIPDFIKIDTQGSEFKILTGASHTLKKFSPIVLAETWLVEVYKNAETTEQILSLMKNLDYIPLAYNLAAAWKYKNSKFDSHKSNPALIGMDFIFVKNPTSLSLSDISDEQLIKQACLLEVYGFRHLSAFLIENSRLEGSLKNSLMRRLEENEAKDKSFAKKITKLKIPLVNSIIKKSFNIYDYKIGLHY